MKKTTIYKIGSREDTNTKLIMKRSFLWDDPPICTLGVAVTVNYKKQASGGSRIFLTRGAYSKSWCANLLFCKFFAENCMKMKKIGSQGGMSLAPLGFGNARGRKLGANVGYC